MNSQAPLQRLRSWLCVISLVSVCGCSVLQAARAQQSGAPQALISAPPSALPKLVKFIVPFSPGGSNDVLARTIAQKLGDQWKQAVVVENSLYCHGQEGSWFGIASKEATGAWRQVLETDGVFVALATRANGWREVMAGGPGFTHPVLRYNGKQTDVAYTDPSYRPVRVTLKAYTLANAAIDYRLTPKVSVFGRVENLFDEDYVSTVGSGGYGNSGDRATLRPFPRVLQ